MHRCDDGQSTRTAPITQLQAITAPAELAADQERAQEAALDVVHSAQSASECTYRQIMLGSIAGVSLLVGGLIILC